MTGAGAGEGGVPCEEPYSCPSLQTLEKSNLKEIPNVGGTILRKTLNLPRMWSPFLTPHEPLGNSKSRQNSYSNNDSKVMKTTEAMAFEPTVPLLGMYILTYVRNDDHAEVFTGAL